jgi:hypothetical protein
MALRRGRRAPGGRDAVRHARVERGHPRRFTRSPTSCAARIRTGRTRGLEAIADGFRLAFADDHVLLRAELPVSDALYAVCRARLDARP